MKLMQVWTFLFPKALCSFFSPYDTWWVSVEHPPGITRVSQGGVKILVWSLFTLNFTLNKNLWPWAIPKSRACSPHIGPYSGDTHGLELYPTFWEPSTRAPYTHSSSSGFLNHRHFYFTFRRSHLIGPAPIFLGTWAALTQHRSPIMLPSHPK
jgi:hypothetical protein